MKILSKSTSPTIPQLLLKSQTHNNPKSQPHNTQLITMHTFIVNHWNIEIKKMSDWITDYKQTTRPLTLRIRVIPCVLRSSERDALS